MYVETQKVWIPKRSGVQVVCLLLDVQEAVMKEKSEGTPQKPFDEDLPG